MKPNAWELCDLTIDEWLALDLDTRIRLAASSYLGWRYGEGRFAFGGGVIDPKLVGPPSTTNCSTFTVALLTAAYPNAPWTQQDYKDLQIFTMARPLSPIDAVVRLKIGSVVPVPLEGRWHLVQGWRTLGVKNTDGSWKVKPSGHSFKIKPSGSVYGVLQAAGAEPGDIGPSWGATTLDEIKKEFKALYGFAVLD